MPAWSSDGKKIGRVEGGSTQDRKPRARLVTLFGFRVLDGAVLHRTKSGTCPATSVSLPWFLILYSTACSRSEPQTEPLANNLGSVRLPTVSHGRSVQILELEPGGKLCLDSRADSRGERSSTRHDTTNARG